MKSDGYFPVVEPLTEREMEIPRLISRGLSNREIARELVITSGTVKWYNRQIYSKLGVHSRTQAVAQAKKAGVFDPTPETPPSPGITPEYNLPAQVTSFVGQTGRGEGTARASCAAVGGIGINSPRPGGEPAACRQDRN